MSLNSKKNTPTASDVFDDDFEVIYEGDLPDISIDDDNDDDYRDVLSGLSDIDHTDYIRKNDYDRLTKKLKDKNRKTSRKSRNQKGKDNFFDTSYYDEDFLDELDDELYDKFLKYSIFKNFEIEDYIIQIFKDFLDRDEEYRIYRDKFLENEIKIDGEEDVLRALGIFSDDE